MPKIRIFGNVLLSFFSKFATGYWNIADPTNGFTAIQRKVLNLIPLEKINKGYLFESDILFRLSILRACVADFPMKSVYANETSNLKIRKVILPFLKGYFIHFLKRIIYNFFLRDFSFSSVSLVFSILFLFIGSFLGLYFWAFSIHTGIFSSSGQVMLVALPLILDFSFCYLSLTLILLIFLNFRYISLWFNFIAEFHFQLLCYYTATIDTERREILDYARFETSWFTIVLTRFTLVSTPQPSASARHSHQYSVG